MPVLFVGVNANDCAGAGVTGAAACADVVANAGNGVAGDTGVVNC